ncbi:hypothetical protein AcV5_000857 [Taiwanofungus camphoratus]|nr:hypothetical protein AcV5_000857 [Antrodia cinnamomea]
MSEDPEKTALTLANLASCASSTLDKTRFVNTYILSQKTYLAAYAAEPRAASSFSNSPPPAAASLSPSRRNIESGFDTPVLKARVPAQHAKDASGKTDCIHTTNHVEESDSNAEDEGDPPSRTRTVRQPTQALQLPKPSRATTKRQSKLNPLQPRPLNQAVPSKRDAYSTTKMKVPPKKRKRSPSTDDERIARLAERRERRRVKRAIVEPRTNVDPNDYEDENQVCAQHIKGQGKTKRRVSLSAGLALMHGFSAKNIGKNRLTHDPELGIGVFNKGKASANVVVKRGLVKPGAPKKTFSESQFLTKTKLDAETATVFSQERSIDTASKVLSHSGSSSKCLMSKARNSVKATKVHGKNNPRFNSARSNVIEVEPLESRKEKAAESVIWDIELEGGSSGPGSDSSGSVRSQQESTVVLNTRAVKWGAIDVQLPTKLPSDGSVVDNCAIAKGTSPAAVRCKGLDAREDHFSGSCAVRDKSSSPSLGPSQSASQIGYCAFGPSSRPLTSNLVSKFFSPCQAHDVSPQRHEIAVDCAETEDKNGSVISLMRSLPNTPKSLKEGSKIDEQSSGPREHESVEAKDDSSGPISIHAPMSSVSLSSLDRELQALDADDLAIGYATCIDEIITTEGLGLAPENGGMMSGDAISTDAETTDAFIFQGLISDHENYGQETLSSDSYRLYDGLSSTWINGISSYTDEDLDSWYVDGVDGSEMPGSVYEDPLEYMQFDTPLDDTIYEGYPKISYHDHDTSHSEVGDDVTPWTSYAASDGIYSRPQTVASTYSNDSLAVSHVTSSQNGASGLYPQLFSQGRALLLGLSGSDALGTASTEDCDAVSSAEKDVAKNLRGHWLPQKF